VKVGSHIVISQNHLHDIVDTAWSPSKGGIAQYKPKDVWWLFNRIHGARYGIRLPSYSVGSWTNYLIGNVIYNIHKPGTDYGLSSWEESGIQIHGPTTAYVLNNTIYDSDAGINHSGSGVVYVENNIVSSIVAGRGNHFYSEISPYTGFLRNNVFHQSDSNERVKFSSEVLGLREWEATYPSQGSGNRADDPRFLAPLNGDFRLGSSSSATQAGLGPNQLPYNVYSKFLTDFGVDIRVDFLRIFRGDSNWDAGAYAYKDSGPTGAPRPPTNLRIAPF
jgi:hypothetical protein